MLAGDGGPGGDEVGRPPLEHERAFGGPTCRSPRQLNRMRSRAFASVTVPTGERGFAPSRSWSTTFAVVSPSSTSTSGRASVGRELWTKALDVSLISHWGSAAIVAKTRDLLPDPETPVKTVSRRFGSSTLTFPSLSSRAPVHADQVVALGHVQGGRRCVRPRARGPCAHRHGLGACLVLGAARPELLEQ